MTRALEQQLLDAVGETRHDEARDVMRLARLSWQLRDDDNLLLARLESQFLRALQLAGTRLKTARRLNADAEVGAEAATVVCATLRADAGTTLSLPTPRQIPARPSPRAGGETPRQLVGQPAARGLATGKVRLIRGPLDLGGFARAKSSCATRSNR